MTFWLLLILGLLTYNILRRNVASITTTPVWLLWVVMMLPATVFTLWGVVAGEDRPVPPGLALGIFLGSCVAYWWLVSAGRIPPSQSSAQSSKSSGSPESSQIPTSSASPKSTSSNQSTDSTITASSSDSAAQTIPLTPPPRPLNTDEEHQLRTCFNWSVFALHSLEFQPQAVICRGSLRTSSERAYATIRGNIEQHFGDRFLVVFQEGHQQPFFLLALNPQSTTHAAEQGTKSLKPIAMNDSPALAIALFFVCVFTTSTAGVAFLGFDPQQLPNNPAWLLDGLPYALGLLAILAAHEFGHFFAARHYQLKSSLPYFIPVPFFLGTLGAFVQLRSPIPNRKVLFDISVAGPIAGLLLTLPLLVWGMAHSSVVEATDRSSLLNFTELQPQFSTLVSLVCRWTLPEGLDPTKAIALHPLAIAGYLGVVLTAFNLMPIGSLDGGRMVHAMFGCHSAQTIARLSRFIMLALTLLNEELFLWTLLLFLISSRDEPALNDVTELDDRRDLLGLACLALLVIILMPAPKLLSSGLGF